MRTARLLLLGVGLALADPAVAADEAAGAARALGPATIAIGGLRLRLAHIGAPMEGARCGPAACADAATSRLAALVGVGTVRCIKERRLGHGIYGGRCSLEDGTDLAETLLREGLARPDGALPPPYAAALEAATVARRGLWASPSPTTPRPASSSGRSGGP